MLQLFGSKFLPTSKKQSLMAFSKIISVHKTLSFCIYHVWMMLPRIILKEFWKILQKIMLKIHRVGTGLISTKFEFLHGEYKHSIKERLSPNPSHKIWLVKHALYFKTTHHISPHSCPCPFLKVALLGCHCETFEIFNMLAMEKTLYHKAKANILFKFSYF